MTTYIRYKKWNGLESTSMFLSCAPVRDVPAGRSRSSFAQVHHMHGSRSRYDPQKQRDLLYCVASRSSLS